MGRFGDLGLPLATDDGRQASLRFGIWDPCALWPRRVLLLAPSACGSGFARIRFAAAPPPAHPSHAPTVVRSRKTRRRFARRTRWRADERRRNPGEELLPVLRMSTSPDWLRQ